MQEVNLTRKTAGIFAVLMLSVTMTFGTASPAFAASSTKVQKNTADWVLEQQAAAEEAAKKKAEAEALAASGATLRQEVVQYALSFVGGNYVYGGTDPHTGADCSGFTRYILQHAAGISVGRTSRDQAGEGRTITADEMQPGDLLFYGSGSHVNHVAMYIGNGQIVHASTERSGIKVSSWNYRTPIRIASFIG